MSDMKTDAEGSGEQYPVKAILVGENDRLSFPARYFGAHRLLGEAHVYACLEFLCDHHQGEPWNFYALSNGGFYMAPQTGKSLRLGGMGNHADGGIDDDSAGIIATIIALSRLARETGEEKFTRLERRLREYAAGLPDAERIIGVADRVDAST